MFKGFYCLAPAFFFWLITGTVAVKPSLAQESSIMWGAVGHSRGHVNSVWYPYKKISRWDQFELIEKFGGKAYRTSCSDIDCDNLIKIAAQKRMVFLRSIEIQPIATMNEDENYWRAYNYAYPEVKKHKGRIQYFEAGNELDNWAKPKNLGVGPLMYDSDRYVLVRGFLRGLIDGIRAGDSSAKVLVNSTGWCHYGFMKQLWGDGVRWDITAVHWYEAFGDFESGCRGTNVASIYASFGRPIWFTEFNSNVAAKENDPDRSAKWIESFVKRTRELAPKYNIQAAFVYELLDEPQKQGAERYFGIADEDGNPKAPWHALKKAINHLNEQNVSPKPAP